MNEHDATETAYKNGYKQGKIDAVREMAGTDLKDAERWEINFQHLTKGLFGDPRKPETMARYWRAQAEAGYPYASESARYYEEKMKEDMNR